AFIDVGLVMWVSRSHFGLAERCLYLSIFIGAFLVSTGYFLYSLFESRIRISRQTMVESEMEYLRLQLDSLQDVKENEEQIKKMRHDLASHLAVMNSLCEDGNYDEIRKYAKQLSHDAAYSGGKILTGNPIADLVVGSKMKTAKEHGIEFAFEGSLENLSNMSAPDICGLLSNAYDNAIEACLTKEHAYIRTKVSTTRNYTVIQIINSVDQKVSVRSNRIATTKADKKAHGCGIEIMKQLAQKYHGSCTVSCSDTEFELKITLLK
ncbi:MAG: GHKL domain-containing protein, partial [Lachnospiraceae bacterium]|nr:GHKL domain-containing protein [Lachnospiraceae bacterium]